MLKLSIKKALVFLLLSLVLLVIQSCTTSTQFKSAPYPTGPFTNDGRWILDSYGRVLLVHGVNMVYKQPPYYPAADGFSNQDAELLFNHGFFIVRVGVLATGLMPSPAGINESYITNVAQTVKMLARYHILSLIDFHQDGWGPSLGNDGFPQWMTITGDAQNTHTTFPLYYISNPAIQAAFQNFWQNAQASNKTYLLNDYALMFKALAERFKNDPTVIGYDLFNEPWPGTNWSSCFNGCPDLDKNELNKAYSLAAAAIRDTGSKQIIFGEPFVLFNFGSETTYISPPGGSHDGGMSFHIYPFPGSYSSEFLAEKSTIQKATKWSQLTGGALLNTEWGATSDTTVLRTTSSLLNENLIPWIFWSFDREIVKNLHQPLTGNNLVASTLLSLTQPYPVAIAGTPLKYSYDFSNNNVVINYSTTNPAGLNLASKVPSLIFIPKQLYPKGFSIHLQNATILGRCHSGLLSIKATNSASIAKIKITPGGRCH
jgi:endoglycosylceramidase